MNFWNDYELRKTVLRLVRFEILIAVTVKFIVICPK
jgi:hypothetical protein